jgi:hypothetical protein
MTEVVGLALVVGEKIHRTVRRDEFGMLGYEICVPMRLGAVRNERLNDGRTAYGGPERLDRARELVYRDREP